MSSCQYIEKQSNNEANSYEAANNANFLNQNEPTLLCSIGSSNSFTQQQLSATETNTIKPPNNETTLDKSLMIENKRKSTKDKPVKRLRSESNVKRKAKPSESQSTSELSCYQKFKQQQDAMEKRWMELYFGEYINEPQS